MDSARLLADIIGDMHSGETFGEIVIAPWSKKMLENDVGTVRAFRITHSERYKIIRQI